MTLYELVTARSAGGRLARWSAARRFRRQEHTLAGLSAHILRDIGLERNGERLPDPLLRPLI